MAIRVSCQCGKQLSVKDEYAGKRVKCPGCGGPLLIPETQAQASSPSGATRGPDGITDLLDDAGLRAGVVRCPGCGAEMSEQAVLCVMCGFDLRRGHRIKARVGSAVEFDDEDLGDLPVHGVAQLDKAERDMARDKLQQKSMSKGAPWWMILLALLGVVGFTIGMVAMPQDLVMRNSGFILQVAGILLGTWFGIKLLIEGFRESTACGLLMIFLPFYSLYYVITRWDRVGGIFLFILFANFLQGIGVAMVELEPYFRGQDDDGYSLRQWQHRTVAVRVFNDVNQI
jgi:hypothetical protein